VPKRWRSPAPWAATTFSPLPACRYYRVQVDALTDPVVELDFHAIVKRGRAQPQALPAFRKTLVEVLEPLLGH
jgi:hypothetical protein